jgi:hypothetical protein
MSEPRFVLEDDALEFHDEPWIPQGDDRLDTYAYMTRPRTRKTEDE